MKIIITITAITLMAFSFAQAIDCSSFTNNLDSQCAALGEEECRKALDECEQFYQQRSDLYQTEINKISSKKKSLENEIWSLNSQIKNLSNKIYKNNLIIKDLGFQITDTEYSIEDTKTKIEIVRDKLGVLLQLRYEQDQTSLLEVFLAEQTFSGFFDDLMAVESLNKETQDLYQNITGLKISLEGHKESMVSEKKDIEHTQILVGLQKEESQDLKTEKNTLLDKTKGQEALYQKYLQETEARAHEIRKKKFELAQVDEGEAITLEQAYVLASQVEDLTGVRAALLLGLLRVESNIGKNVGQCNCTTCNYPNIHWKEIMTSRHWPYFEQITKELGRDPNNTPVSCAVSGGKVQWGGAMGPAQFMPQTWIEYGYKERVEKVNGVKPASPWRIKDAFVAAGLYLSDWGATAQTELKEIGAVRAYLCGTTRLTWTCRISGGNTYTYNVMHYAKEYQGYIDKGVFK